MAIVAATLIITVCVLFLLFKGIGLRSAPLIQPSVISNGLVNIPHSIVYRLFQEFQNSDFVLWGISEDEKLNSFLIAETKAEYIKLFKKEVTIVSLSSQSSQAGDRTIKSCPKPCWVLMPFKDAHQLSDNNFIKTHQKQFENNYFTLTLIKFNRNNVVSDKCESQKRLDLDCLISLSIREARRRFKLENQKYFFLRKYNLSDYFLFVEN